MTARVAVVDYGAGNMYSIEQALRFVGAEAVVVADADEWAAAEPTAAVLPGVGAYGRGMAALSDRGLDVLLRAHAASMLPLLGICLGAQLLLEGSSEFGDHDGLGIIEGSAVPFDSSRVRVPHIGWGQIAGFDPAEPLFDAIPDQSWMYFVHSFHLAPTDSSAAMSTTALGSTSFTSAISRGSTVGFQFHPEKSGPLGLRLLRNFLTSKVSE